MKYLLDTHAVIWYFEDSQKFPQKTVKLVDNPDNSVFISSVSLWEIAIKINLGKLGIKSSFDDLLDAVNTSDFEILQIQDDYLKLLSTLPNIHKDPFDRLIITSAIAEDLTIITADENMQKYDVRWVW